MVLPSVLLLVIGLLGAFDIAWFHTLQGRLVARPECRREVAVHVARGFVYAVQFAVIPNLELRGAWTIALALLFAIDVIVGVTDIVIEPESRAAQGGISGHEYLVHMILSLLVGAELLAVALVAVPLSQQATAIAVTAAVPAWLRGVLAIFALGSAGCAILEGLVAWEASRPPAAPLHVRVRLAAPLARVWDVTQDHRLHPRWDHRFDRIAMCHDEAGEPAAPLGTPDPRIRTGTTMRYEKRVLGMTIAGWGRYKLHKPMRQSTFEFGSADPRSLIVKGVGLWLYEALPGGLVEMSTSYTYEVRYGLAGRLFDRWVFRPIFQRFTEASFRRLARDFFGDDAPVVLGRAGRRPERFTPASTRSPRRFGLAERPVLAPNGSG